MYIQTIENVINIVIQKSYYKSLLRKKNKQTNKQTNECSIVYEDRHFHSKIKMALSCTFVINNKPFIWSLFFRTRRSYPSVTTARSMIRSQNSLDQELSVSNNKNKIKKRKKLNLEITMICIKGVKVVQNNALN